MMITDFCICGPNLAEAEEHARKYMGKFVESNFHHYEFLGEHFATVKGYDAYVQKAAIARQGGLEGAVDGVHAGGDLGHARAHPARVGGAARGDRRFRAQRGVPLWRRAVRRSPSAG